MVDDDDYDDEDDDRNQFYTRISLRLYRFGLKDFGT